jgi:transcriptional regulator with XRE-family HTH domain
MKSLREWRLERVMGTDTLAAKAGVSNKTIIQIEHGRQLPRPRTIRRLSEALDVEPRDVTEFNQALDDMGKEPALNDPGRDGNPVDAATSAGPRVV